MIDNTTYEELKNAVVTWIRNNCSNFGDKYDAMNNCVKDGIRYAVGTTTGGSYSETVYYTIQSPLKSAADKDWVNEDMDAFYAKIGSPSGYITEDKFYDYLNDLVSFCCTKLAFITSQYGINRTDTVRYLVYFRQNTTFAKQVYISPSVAKTYIIKAIDVNDLWQNIIKMMIQNKGYIRVLNVTCKFSLDKNH